jgi:predicted nucleic acid-binding protein
MTKCVLDSSVIIKGLLQPSPSIPSPILERELDTHKKCEYLLKLVEMLSVEVCIPKVCIVEVAAVTRRLTDMKMSQIIAERLFSSCTLTSEEELFTAAWALATTQGSSGFDTYFISLAFLHNIPLITDDMGMHTHAVKKGIKSFLVRETTVLDIEMLLSRDAPAWNNG